MLPLFESISSRFLAVKYLQKGIFLLSYRGALRPASDKPYRGIYYKDGDIVKKDDLLVCQVRLNYFPGLNVSSLI